MMTIGAVFARAMELVSGLLVRSGTRRGDGCPSGHGVCGTWGLSLAFVVAGAVVTYALLSTRASGAVLRRSLVRASRCRVEPTSKVD